MSQTEPLVSIVTPVYNGAAFIRDCIDSVLAQKYQNWDYLIQDNCSTDGTAEILEEYRDVDPRIRIVRNPELVPANTNWNLAFSKISADSHYAQMLHADDYLHPDCLAKKVALAEQYPSMGIIGSLTEADGDIWGDGLDPSTQFINGSDLTVAVLSGRSYPFLAPVALLIRSDAVRSRKPFYDDDIHADISALYEVLKQWDFGMVHEVLTYVRLHDDNISAQEAAPLNRFLITNMDLLLKYGPSVMSDETYTDVLNGRLRGYYQFLARCKLEGRDDAFWDYHQGAMDDFGMPINSGALSKAVLKEFVSRPLSALGLLKRRFSATA
ncbi:MAG: glycosyltransferase family 2 protein [Pseudomonadota bacterium]